MAQEPIVIDATVGGADSNSFLTLAELDALVHARPFHAEYDSITDDEVKHAALIWATRTLCSYRWQGLIVSTDQKLSFPRSDLYDLESRVYASDALPDWLKFACSELAFIFATEDRTKDSGTEGFSEIKVASISLKIDKSDRPKDVPDTVFSIFSYWVKQGSQFNAAVNRV